MSEIERMKAYCERTEIPKQVKLRYSIGFNDFSALLRMGKDRTLDGLYDSIVQAFEYGMAKGYRAALANMKKEATV